MSRWGAWPRQRAALLAALFLAGCAGLSGQPAPAERPVPGTAAERPKLTLPPPPERSEKEGWAEAQRRGQALADMARADVANVTPAPVPEEARPAPAVSAVPPAVVTVPAPVPAPVAAPVPPAAVAPSPPAASPGGPAAAPAVSRASVPSVRVVQKYTSQNGLPSDRITALYVDDQDAWVGTADAGVARLNFAEGNWIVTKVEDGLASNRVTDIVKYKGSVYVGTQDGISVWDGVAWINHTSAGRAQLLNTVFEVNDGLLWVAARAMHGGFLSYDGERWKDQSGIKPGTVLNNVSDFAFGGKTLWIGTTNRGLYRFAGKDWETITVSDGIASNFVYTLAVREGSAYLGGCCGVSAYEGGAWRIYDIAEGLPHSTVNAIAVDGDLVWFGSKKGLGLFDGFQFTNFYTESGLTDDRITTIFVRGSEVWVGTANGLNRLEKSY